MAYPDGIPFPIASGQVDHLVPRPGQVGDTVFTPLDVEVFRATGQRVPMSLSAESPTKTSPAKTSPAKTSPAKKSPAKAAKTA